MELLDLEGSGVSVPVSQLIQDQAEQMVVLESNATDDEALELPSAMSGAPEVASSPFAMAAASSASQRPDSGLQGSVRLSAAPAAGSGTSGTLQQQVWPGHWFHLLHSRAI